VLALGYILAGLMAYLFGSLPTGFLVAKARGIDIRKVGSGNIGATNVFRALGLPAGVFVLLVDAAKGWFAVWLAPLLMRAICGDAYDPAAHDLPIRIVAGFAAVLGHNYTCWLRFNGGKGIATSAGVVLALVPMALLISAVVFAIVLGVGRYVSLASILASLSLPVAVAAFGYGRTLVAITGLMAAMAVYRHRSNISRLLKGTENRIGTRKTGA